jgi:hypothetical protein
MQEKRLNPAQVKRRAGFDRLVASLEVPQYSKLAHLPKIKTKPGVGAMRTA